MAVNEWQQLSRRTLSAACECDCVCVKCVRERFRRSRKQSSLPGHSAEITAVLATSVTGLISSCPPCSFTI